MIKKILLAAVLLFLPSVVFAVSDVYELVELLLQIFMNLIEVTFIFIVVAFFWGIGIFVLNTQDPKKLEEGKQWMFWAVVAFFVAWSLWGIMGFLEYSLGADPVIIPTKGIPA